MKLHYKLFCKNIFFLFSTRVEENKSHVKGIINSILHTNKYHKMKERNFRKIQEKEISNLEF